MEKNTIIFHAHLAKTAGSSFNRFVARRYYGVCGHKGYSFSQNYEDIVREHDDSRYPEYGLDRVHPQRMASWGFHNCAFISLETTWKGLGKLANAPTIKAKTSLMIPCRDPVDHLLSQCNHRELNFTNLSTTFGNCSAVIAHCSFGWDRYDHALLQYFDKTVLFKYDAFDAAAHNLDGSLPKRIYELEKSSP